MAAAKKPAVKKPPAKKPAAKRYVAAITTRMKDGRWVRPGDEVSADEIGDLERTLRAGLVVEATKGE